MINVEDSTRIIGDFLEINADIVERRFKSKLPKILANIEEKHSRNKLIKSAKKIQESNMILSIYNLSELFIYTFNNFPPNGKYKSIMISKVVNDSNNIEAVIKFEDIVSIINIDKKENTIDVNITQDNNTFFTRCNGLLKHSKKGSRVDIILMRINKELLNTITDYIIETLESYNRKDK